MFNLYPPLFLEQNGSSKMYVKSKKTYNGLAIVRYVTTAVLIILLVLSWTGYISPVTNTTLSLIGLFVVVSTLVIQNYILKQLKLFLDIVRLTGYLRYSRGPRYFESYSSDILSVQEMFVDEGGEKTWLNSKIVLHKWNLANGEGLVYVLRQDSIERSTRPEVRISLEELSNLQELLTEAVALKKMSFTF